MLRFFLKTLVQCNTRSAEARTQRKGCIIEHCITPHMCNNHAMKQSSKVENQGEIQYRQANLFY